MCDWGAIVPIKEKFAYFSAVDGKIKSVSIKLAFPDPRELTQLSVPRFVMLVDQFDSLKWTTIRPLFLIRLKGPGVWELLTCYPGLINKGLYQGVLGD